MGRFGKGRFARYFGLIGVLIPLGVSTYYMFIETWTFGYFLKFLTGGIGIDPASSSADSPRASRSSCRGPCPSWRSAH